jgi:type II secretory pathway predicted ATPase ExeA
VPHDWKDDQRATRHSSLHRVASGLPRALNNAATAALIAAAGDGKDLVDDACAKKAVAELTRD